MLQPSPAANGGVFTVLVGSEHTQNGRDASGSAGTAAPRARTAVGGSGLTAEDFRGDEGGNEKQTLTVTQMRPVRLAPAALRRESKETHEVVNVSH